MKKIPKLINYLKIEGCKTNKPLRLFNILINASFYRNTIVCLHNNSYIRNIVNGVIISYE